VAAHARRVRDAFALLSPAPTLRLFTIDRGRPRPRGVGSFGSISPGRKQLCFVRSPAGVWWSNRFASPVWRDRRRRRHSPAGAAPCGEVSSRSLTSPSYNELSFAKCCCHRFYPCPRPPGHRHQPPPACRQRDEMAEPLHGYGVRRRLNINGDLAAREHATTVPRKRLRACHNNLSKSAMR